MGLELKRRSKQYLKDIPNAIDLDGDGGNRVFGISDFPKYLGEGKNSFKINPLGRAIKPNTNIDIEVLDSNGRPIYWEIPTYKDGDNSRLISIWVYDVVDEKYHTPNGTCEIIIVAEGRSGPIRHTITTNVVKTKKSISEIVFSDTPNGSVSASIQTFTNLPQTDGTLTQVTQSGEFTYKKSIYGEDVSFEANTSIINGEMLSGSLELDLSSTTLFPILGGGQSQPTSITASISEVISSTLFRIPLPITASDNRSNGSIHTYEYSDDTISGLIRYQSTGSNTNTQNQVAIANISLTSVNPNSGRINSVNTLIKSEGLSNSDYELLSNTQVPNESDITYRVPIPTEHLNDPKSIKVQFLNSAGDVSSTEVIINNVIFEGGNVYIGGNQSIVTGSLFISNAIGSGLEIGGHSSGFLKSVGYEGQISASEGSGPGGFIIYSGSNALQMGADVLQGVGMQFVGDNDDRHLIFTTHDGGLLDVKTDKFFIGTQNTQFISGSDSNIEISSSLFHLDPKNDRLVIGADAIIEADLSANNIRTPATIGGVQSTDLNASSSIKSDGFARFVSASIGGWGIDTGSIFSDNLEINSSGKIKTRDYISDTKGWLIDETGIAEFANVKIRGTLATTTFEKESVNAVGGQLYVANSTTLSGSYSSSLDSTPANGVTSSASLPSQLGNTATDYLEFNSVDYLITSVDDTDKFTIDSAIYADGASATLHYSQSNSFSSQISASVVTSVTTTTNTPVSASVKNGIDLNGNETSFRLSNYSAITPIGYPTSNWFNKSVTISNRNNNSVFTVGGVETIGTITSVSPLEIELDSDSIDSTYAGIPIGGDTEDFYISFTSQSTTTTTTNAATENVIKKAGTWPTSIVNDGEITFNDGGGSRTYTVLERVDSITLRVDTSSYAPNTSGSFVVATGAYSSSHSVGVTISAGTGSTTEYFYDNVSLSSSQFIVDNVSGFAVDEILTLKKVTNTGFSTEYVQVVSSSRLNGGSDTDLSGILNVTRAYGSGLTGDSSSLGDIASNSQSYDNGQVVVSTGKVGSGYIRLNANPNDTSTPYMDIVERTGSGLYDIELKARLGDLSGLSGNDLVHGRSNPGFGLATDNVYLQGGIIATFGEIGGFSIDTNTISSSNNNLILRDNGQITGSQVLLDGGTIGGFELGSDIISSSNGELVLKSNGEITGSAVNLTGNINAEVGTFKDIDVIGLPVESSSVYLLETWVTSSSALNGSTLTLGVGSGFKYGLLQWSSSYVDNGGSSPNITTTDMINRDYTDGSVGGESPTPPPTFKQWWELGGELSDYPLGSSTGLTPNQEIEFETPNSTDVYTITSDIIKLPTELASTSSLGGMVLQTPVRFGGSGGFGGLYPKFTMEVLSSTDGVLAKQEKQSQNGSEWLDFSIPISSIITFYSGNKFRVRDEIKIRLSWTGPQSSGGGTLDYVRVGELRIMKLAESPGMAVSNITFRESGMSSGVDSTEHLGDFVPHRDNFFDLGKSSTGRVLRWDDVYATNGTIQTSDETEKTNITSSDLGLSFVNQLRPVSYKWIGKERTHYGLIAQEVSSSLDVFGKTTSDFAGITTGSLMGLRYNELISPMIKAIQELSDEVTQLKLQLSQSQG